MKLIILILTLSCTKNMVKLAKKKGNTISYPHLPKEEILKLLNEEKVDEAIAKIKLFKNLN